MKERNPESWADVLFTGLKAVNRGCLVIEIIMIVYVVLSLIALVCLGWVVVTDWLEG